MLAVVVKTVRESNVCALAVMRITRASTQVSSPDQPDPLIDTSGRQAQALRASSPKRRRAPRSAVTTAVAPRRGEAGHPAQPDLGITAAGAVDDHRLDEWLQGLGGLDLRTISPPYSGAEPVERRAQITATGLVRADERGGRQLPTPDAAAGRRTVCRWRPRRRAHRTQAGRLDRARRWKDSILARPAILRDTVQP